LRAAPTSDDRRGDAHAGAPESALALVGWSRPAAAARARALTAEGHDVVLVEDVLEIGFDALAASIAGRALLIALPGPLDSPWPWVAALDAIATVRAALAGSGGRVTLVTDVETAPAAVATNCDAMTLDRWVDDARVRVRQPCPPWRVADLCRALVPEGTSLEAARAIAVAAAMRALTQLLPADRVDHVVDPGAWCEAPGPMDPPLRVAPPPRPFRPDVVADRQQRALWDGCLKYGNQWTHRLERMLDEVLALGPDRRVVVTASGTDALRLAVAAVVPAPAPGATAILPSFTFPATAEVLVQLGYALRFVDVDRSAWTLDPGALDCALDRSRADVVVAVDTMGNPARYDELLAVCGRHGVPLVADSAAALGSRYRGRPVGTQAAAHGFSMSFAKAVSAGGAGGAVVVPADADLPVRSGWPRNAMSELHAIAGVDQLEILPALMQQRGAVRDVYEALVQRHDRLSSQAVAPGDRHALGFWVMRVGAGLRAGLQAHLAAAGIETKVYYPALHLSGWDGTDEGLPVSTALDAEALALPMSSELTVARAERVAAAVDRFMTEARPPAR
jgi:dTDP-4-amino-4,6-dideoxygalactose transaminase